MTHYAQPKAPGTPTWTDITSPDPEASRKFYRAVFGWEFDVGGPEFGGYATGRKGKYTTAGVGGNMPGAPPAPERRSVACVRTVRRDEPCVGVAPVAAVVVVVRVELDLP